MGTLAGAGHRLFIFATLLFAGAMTYRLARLWMNRYPAAAAGAFYVIAPYTLKMMFHEGTLPRSLGFAFIPLVFYVAVRLMESRDRRWVVFLALSLMALILSHQFTGMTTLLALGIFCAVYGLFMVPLSRLIMLALAVLLGLGLVAWWLIPSSTHLDLPDVPNLGPIAERVPA